MATALRWKPVNPPEEEALTEGLKLLFRGRFGFPCTLSRGNHADYVQGLVDANMEGATRLQQILNEHEEIELWEQR